MALNSAHPIPADRCRSDRCRVPAGLAAAGTGMPITAWVAALVMPTTTGSAIWVRPVPRRTRLLVATAQPVMPPPVAPARRRSAALSLPLAFPRDLCPHRQLTPHCRRGQPAPAGSIPGRVRARHPLSRHQKAGGPSAGGPMRVGRVRPAHRLPRRRLTTRCRARAPRAPDLGGHPLPVSTVPRVLPGAFPSLPHGLMTTGQNSWGQRVPA